MNLFIYLIEVSVASMVLYGLYILLFRRFTFFRLNRAYILAAMIISMVLPLIKFSFGTIEYALIDDVILLNWDEIMSTGSERIREIGDRRGVDLLNVVLIAYLTISAVRFFIFLYRLISIRSYYSGGILEMQAGVKWKIHPKVRSPFTVFRTVYLDSETFRDNNSPVKHHEAVHARQLHSLDLVVSEILCAFLWFNPFVFLFKRQMRENHEYIADEAVRRKSGDLQQYLRAFSKELTRFYDPAFASHFQSSTIKNRIMMITKNRSKNRYRYIYLVTIPLIAMLAMAFQRPAENLINDIAGLSIEQQGHGHAMMPVTDGPVIPYMFPLEEKYMKGVTFEYNKEAKNPFTGKMMTHIGIDYKAPTGTGVFAAGDGVVAKAEMHEKYGNLIVITHAESFATLYGHLDKLLVAAGQEVKAGTKIGTVGNTGYSTGPHLHYEVRKDGENVNPADYY